VAQLREVDVDEALELIDQGALLIDVREENEWEAGRSAHAQHIALSELPDHLADLAKDRLIVCVCRSGARSLRATGFLIEQGFEAVNLSGGMLAWEGAEQPLVADGDEPAII
jgi:rhodanese-related sulfurtransferase